MNLFREEVLAEKQRDNLGVILLARPVALSVYTAVALCILVLLAGFLTWGEFTRKERLSGRIFVAQGVSKVYSPVVGTVVRKNVREGQFVRKGATLYVVAVDRHTTKGDTQAALAGELARKRGSLKEQMAVQKQLLAREQMTLERKVADLEAQRMQLDSEIEIQRKRAGLSEASLTRFRELFKDKFISAAQLSEREHEKLDQEARLQSLKRARTTLGTELDAARAMLRNAPLNAEATLATTERSLIAVEQETIEYEAQREVAIVAPHDGTATAILFELGQTVTPQSSGLSLVPANAVYQAYLFAPSRAIGFLEGGEKVLMRYEAYPYQKFGQYGGRIASVSRAALAPGELQVLNAAPETLYRVTIELDQQYVTAYGKRQGLQDGMQVEADVMLETRKLYEWVLEPLYSLTGKL